MAAALRNVCSQTATNSRILFRPLLGRRRLPSALIAAWLTLIGWPGCAVALEVAESYWGFDTRAQGHVVEHRFNLLSVRLVNAGRVPFDGELRLQKLDLAGARVDAPVVEPVYLAPGGERWIQFCPYVRWPDREGWRLSWGPREAGSFDVPRGLAGRPAVALLEEVGAFSRRAAGLARFPEALFPAHVTATDGLAGVVLDHLPRWDEARQQAFVEWLARGGRVHVFQGVRGELPRFPGELAMLNGPDERKWYRAGLVWRHERRLHEIDPSFVQQVIVAGRDPVSPTETPRSASETRPGEEEVGLFSSFIWEGDDTLLTSLKKMSRAEHWWGLIHLLSFVYLGMVWPGCWMIGRRRGGDYRVTFGALLGAVALFSACFLIVGRRGYGEVSAVHTVAIVRTASEKSWDVTAWSNAFAVTGGDYRLEHEGTGRFYSSCQNLEFVQREIRMGQGAGFDVDLPPYSGRAFGWRAVVAGQPLDVEVIDVQTAIESHRPVRVGVDSAQAAADEPERIITRLQMNLSQGFPANIEQAILVCGKSVYLLAASGRHLRLERTEGRLTDVLRSGLLASPVFNDQVIPDDERSRRELFAGLFPVLVTRSLDLADQASVRDFRLPEGRARLLVYASLPDNLRMKDSRFGTQRGRCLYLADVSLNPRS